jgi:type VI secretion system protein ImpF
MPRDALRILPSVVDRLIDDTLDRPADAPVEPAATSTWAWDLDDLLEAVRRDLSWLLNTRRTPPRELPPGEPDEDPARDPYYHLRRSCFTYGLSDPSSISSASDRDLLRLKAEMAKAVELYEPRLRNVGVTQLTKEDQPADGTPLDLWFEIVGDLRVEGTEIPVHFETRLKIENRLHRVRAETA